MTERLALEQTNAESLFSAKEAPCFVGAFLCCVLVN